MPKLKPVKARPVGYRIRHRTLRNCVAAVEVGWRELAHNPAYGVHGRCPVCGVVHTVKTYHLNVDDGGCCNVSPKVFDQLCKAGAIDGVPADQLMQPNGKNSRWGKMLAVPFEYVDQIEPPPLTIGFDKLVVDGEGRVLQRPGMRVLNMHEDYE